MPSRGRAHKEERERCNEEAAHSTRSPFTKRSEKKLHRPSEENEKFYQLLVLVINFKLLRRRQFFIIRHSPPSPTAHH